MRETAINLAIVIGLLGVGSGIGYYFAPAKVVTVEKVVEKRVVDRNIKVVTTKTIEPSGKPKIVTETLDLSKDRTDKQSDVKISVTREKKDWMISGTYMKDMTSGRDTVSGGLSRRVFGEVYVGVYGTSDGKAGVGVTFRF